MPKMPTVSSKKFRIFLEREGCTYDGVEGDHYVYRKASLVRPIVVPVRKDLPIFIILNNLRTLGMTRAEFIRALKEM